MYCSQREKSRVNRIMYPLGKNRMETIGILAFSIIMGMSMMSVVLEAINRIIAGLSPASKGSVNFDIISIVILSTTILSKFIMAIVCHRINVSTPNAVVETYAQDHRNDVLTNIVGTAGITLTVCLLP